MGLLGKQMVYSLYTGKWGVYYLPPNNLLVGC